MKTNNHILLLSLQTFSNHGGVAQVSKNLCSTLSAICKDQHKELKCLSLYDGLPDEKYIQPARFKGFKHCRIKFLAQVLNDQRKATTIVLTHVNLLPIAWIIRKLNRKVSFILIAHGVEIWRELSGWEKRFLKEEATIWAVSAFTKSVIEKIQDLPPDRIQVLHNSLDPHFRIPSSLIKPVYLLKRYGLRNQKILLSITRMSCHDRLKGYDRVITAMPYLISKQPELHYLLCGSQDKEEKARLQRLITELNMGKHISLIDYLPAKELTDHYLLGDTFVLPSTKEGFGIAFIEAASCGCYLISGDQDGSRAALLNGRLGSMIDPHNRQALQKSILKSLHPKLRENAKTRQALCIAHFSADEYQRRILQLLKSTAAFQ